MRIIKTSQNSFGDEEKKLSKKFEEQDKLKDVGPADHFEWHLNFNEVFGKKEGFDVVIANPPYGAQFDREEKLYLKSKYPYSTRGKYESYRIFIELGFRLAKNKGIVTYVVSNTWMFIEQAFPLRRHLLEKHCFKSIVSFPQKSFDATVDSVSFVLQKMNGSINNHVVVVDMPLKADLKNLSQYLQNKVIYSQNKWLQNDKALISYGTADIEMNLINKIKKKTDSFADHLITKQGLIPYLTKDQGKENKYISSKKFGSEWKDFLDGSRFVGKYYIKPHLSFIKYGDWLYAPRKKWIFQKPRIIFQLIRNISLKRRIVATYSDNELYSDRNTGLIFLKKESPLNLKYILGIFNSAFINFVHSKTHNSTYISFPSIHRLPLKIASMKQRQGVMNWVNKILSLTKSDDYLTNSKKQNKVKEYEKQIDELVYKLYNLTPEEIRIVEGVNNKSKKPI